MDHGILLVLACTILTTSAWSVQQYPGRRAPLRFTRFAPSPPHLHQNPHPRRPTETADVEESNWQRQKRGHDDYDHDHHHDHHHDHRHDRRQDHRRTSGVTGPVHTFVKTDKNANYKWGVRHHVGDKYAS